MRVITSAFHAPRARHLFHVALSQEARIEVTVLPVANGCSGELLESYLAKERRSLEALRAEPFGAWLEFLRAPQGAEELMRLNGSAEVCEAHFLSQEAMSGRRRALCSVLKTSRRCRRRLCEDSPFSSSETVEGAEKRRKGRRSFWAQFPKPEEKNRIARTNRRTACR